MVEALISIIGMWLSRSLLDIELSELIAAILPGVGLALMCAVAVIAGKITASALDTHGVATLLSSWDRPRSFIAGANPQPRCACSQAPSVAARPRRSSWRRELQ